MSERRGRLHLHLALTLGLALLGCRRSEPEPASRESRDLRAGSTRAEPRRDTATAGAELPAPATGPFLEGAAFEGRYATREIAALMGSMPRPTDTDSPLVSVFAGVVDAFVGDARARLAALGLSLEGEIQVSARVLDGRAAAVRKLLGELRGDAVADPALVAQLRSEARTLGVALRASLPAADAERLLASLRALLQARADPALWTGACAALGSPALCLGDPQLVMWARPESGVDGVERVRVDVVYLFYAGAEPADLERALLRAQDWPGVEARETLAADAPMQMQLHAGPTLALLEAEALADAVADFVAEERELDYPAFLDRERALGELVPEQAIFAGLDLALDYDEAGERLELGLRWLPNTRRPPGGGPEVELASLFAPVVERGSLPVLHGDCARAQACMRAAGLSSVLRFEALAAGAFADTTGASRVLRQAGDRGLVLLGLSSWPNLLGTAATLATPSRGLTGSAQAALLTGSFGFGLFLLELGDAPASSFGQRFVAYLRVDSKALAQLRAAASLVGVGPRPVALEGLDAEVERGAWEELWVYFVDERLRLGGFGGWVVLADADERVRWLLETPREASEPAAVDPLWYLRVDALGALAAREQVSYADDPPVRRWLDGRSLELKGRFTPAGPVVELELGPRQP